MSGGFRVDPDALDVGSRRVAELAGRVRAAAGARSALGPGVYGLLGQGFAVAVVAASGDGSAAVGRLGERATALAEQLRGAGADYRRTERAAASGLRGPR